VQDGKDTNLIPSYIENAIDQETEPDFKELLHVIRKLCDEDQTQRYSSYLSILQTPPFVAKVYTTPIPGTIKATSMLNTPEAHARMTGDMFKQQVRVLLSFVSFKCRMDGNGLVAMIGLTLMYRMWLHVNVSNSKTMAMLVAAVGWIASGYMNHYVAVDDMVGLFGNQFHRDELLFMIQTVFNKLNGITRIPTLYDTALTQQEVIWGITVYADKPKYIHTEPQRLHEHYVNKVETEAQKLGARIPKGQVIDF
jgi:hypothetical protein